MKKWIIPVFATFFLFVQNLAAQPPQRRTPEERAKQETEWMKKELNLTDAQAARVDSLNLKYAKELQQVREKDFTDRQERFEAMKTVRDKKTEELKRVLDEKQFSLYQEKIKDFFQGRQGNREQRH
jgi:dipeptidase